MDRMDRSDRTSEAVPLHRRTFLATTGAGLAGILAARTAPAFAQGTKLHLLRWVDFIPACDVELKRQAGDASKALGAEVQFEFVNANDLQPRITAAIQSQSGPDIIQMLHNWPHLYASALTDVSDLADWQGKEQGAYYGQRRPPPGSAASGSRCRTGSSASRWRTGSRGSPRWGRPRGRRPSTSCARSA